MACDWTRLLDRLRAAFGCPDLNFRHAPCPVKGGYSHHLWRLDVAGSRWPHPRSLLLRTAKRDPHRLGHEVRVLHWLTASGYPVGTPLLWGEDEAVMGTPFALLDWVPGRTLAAHIVAAGWGGAGQTIGRLLAALHALSPAGFPRHPSTVTGPPLTPDTAALLGPERLATVRAARPDILAQGQTHPQERQISDDLVARYQQAGATWWIEDRYLSPVDERRERLWTGPPRLAP
jgi:hypothetical protein